jgi:hypothetical protein
MKRSTVAGAEVQECEDGEEVQFRCRIRKLEGEEYAMSFRESLKGGCEGG